MNKREERIRNGIKFFRQFGERNWDALQVKKFFPLFLDLVQDFINGAPEEIDNTEELIATQMEINAQTNTTN